MQARMTFFNKKCIFEQKKHKLEIINLKSEIIIVTLHSIMNRFTLGKIVKFFLHLHYDIRVTGEEVLRDNSVHLVMPNHSAYIDPVILFAEEWWLPMCPMSDERFVRHSVYGRFLKMADVMEVPDLTKSAMTREEGVEATRQLSRVAIDTLAAGKPVCLYPSGHVMLVNRVRSVPRTAGRRTRDPVPHVGIGAQLVLQTVHRLEMASHRHHPFRGPHGRCPQLGTNAQPTRFQCPFGRVV